MRLINGKASTLSRVAGFTLLEVMLTLAILAVGLLGLAAMQVVGLKSGSTASYRSIATLVASEMSDRMRANKDGLGTIVTDPKTGKPDKAKSTESLFKKITAGSPDADCGTLPKLSCASWLKGTEVVPAEDCNASAMAAWDINVMYCGNPKSADNPGVRAAAGLKMLPEGSMNIVCSDEPCYPGSEHVITVNWQERPEKAAAGTPSVERALVMRMTPMRDQILPE